MTEEEPRKSLWPESSLHSLQDRDPGFSGVKETACTIPDCMVILWEKGSRNRNRTLRQGPHTLQQIYRFYQQDVVLISPAEELKPYLKKKETPHKNTEKSHTQRSRVGNGLPPPPAMPYHRTPITDTDFIINPLITKTCKKSSSVLVVRRSITTVPTISNFLFL